MSYDLYFEASSGKKVDRRSFAAHFKSRPHYQVASGQAVYQNEDTGVYFIFDEPTDGVVAFNLNYFRPHVFALEAAPELEEFDKSFGMTVVDPQDEGMGEGGGFAREGFLRGWNAGNRFAYRSMLSEKTDPVLTWPSRRIREVWEWNYTRALMQEEEGQDIFIPTIMALQGQNEPLSVVVWPPECPILMPAVDGVLVPLAQSGKSSEEVALVSWEELSPIVQPYREKTPGIARYRLAFEDWPEEVTAFLGKKRKAIGEVTGVGFDQILDRELVHEARRK